MQKSFFIYGIHSIKAQLDANPKHIIKVLIVDKDNKRIDTIVDELNKHNIKIHQSSKQQLNKLSSSQKHQGIIAQIIEPNMLGENKLVDYITTKKINLILILDSIQDPRNLGACLRSANAAKVDCVLINKNRTAPINALVYKASAGAINKLKIFKISNLVRAIKTIQKLNIWVIGLDTEATQSLYTTNLTAPTAIVIGSEGSGLRKLTKKSCDQLALIPMLGSVKSLNVAVATGIALFEANRQKQS